MRMLGFETGDAVDDEPTPWRRHRTSTELDQALRAFKPGMVFVTGPETVVAFVIVAVEAQTGEPGGVLRKRDLLDGNESTVAPAVLLDWLDTGAIEQVHPDVAERLCATPPDPACVEAGNALRRAAADVWAARTREIDLDDRRAWAAAHADYEREMAPLRRANFDARLAAFERFWLEANRG